MRAHRHAAERWRVAGELQGGATVQMSTAQTETTLITGEELLAMGDIGPCELIDGRIVAMSPTGGRHGIIESRLGSALSFFVQEHNLGWVLTGEVGIDIDAIPTVSGGQISSFCRGNVGRRVPLKDFSKGPQTSSSKSCRPMTVGRKYGKRLRSIFRSAYAGCGSSSLRTAPCLSSGPAATFSNSAQKIF